MIDLSLKAEVYCSNGAVGLSTYLIGNPINHQITHLVLLDPQFLKVREITVPASLIDRVDMNIIFLKADRQSIEALPTTPIQRGQQ